MQKIYFAARNPGPSTQRKCQVCGYAYLALSMSSRTCEFCKTPFPGTLGSGRVRAHAAMAMAAIA